MAKSEEKKPAATSGIGGSAFLTIGEEPVVLTSKSLHPKKIKLEYHAEDFYKAPKLGTLEKAIGELNNKLEKVKIDTQTISSMINQAKEVLPALETMLTADLVLTDLVIDQPEKQYEIGLGMNFTKFETPISICDIKLDGFSLLISVNAN